MRDRPLVPKFSSNSSDPPRLPPQNTELQKTSLPKTSLQSSHSQSPDSRQPKAQQSDSPSRSPAAKGKIIRKQQADTPQSHQGFPQKALSDAALSDFCENVLLTVDCGAAIPLIIQQIKHWTSGQPTLTRIICEQVLKVSDKVTQANAAKLIDQVVQRDILSDWHKGPAADHMRAIAAKLRDAKNKDLLLLLYLRILQQGAAEAASGDERDVLLRSGLVVEQGKRLKIANLIYAKIFGMAWIEKALPGITRPVNVVNSKTSQRASSNSSSNPASGSASNQPASNQPASNQSFNPSSQRLAKLPAVTPAEVASQTDAKQMSEVSPEVSFERPATERPAAERPAKRSSQPLPKQTIKQPKQSAERPSEISGLYSKVAVFICCLAVVTAAISAFRSGTRENVPAASVEINEAGQRQQEESSGSPSDNGTAGGSDNGTASGTETDNRRLFDQGVVHATNGRWLPMVRDFCQISANSTYFTPAQKQVQQWVKLYREDIEIAQAVFLAEDVRGESGGCSIISDVLDARL